MKPAARNFIFSIPAVVWLAVCIATTLALRATMAHAAAAAATAATTSAAPSPPAPATTAPAARTSVRDLLAYGTDQRFWSADVIPFIQDKISGTKTYLRVRSAGDSQWRIIGELEAPAISLANRGTELLVVLEGGDWKIVSDSGARSGNALPGDADVLALAGDGDDVWAIGAGHVSPPAPAPAPPAPAATTSTTTPAATTAAAAAAAPPSGTRATAGATTSTAATAAAADQIFLYQLTHGDWAQRDSLPPDLNRDDLRVVSLAVLDRKLMLALIDSDGVVRLFARGATGGWQEQSIAAVGHARLRLLDVRGRPALWVSDPTGPGALYFAGGASGGGGNAVNASGTPTARWQGPVRLAQSPTLVGFDRNALATALGQLRLLASDGKQRLAEQIYNEDGSLSGTSTPAVTAASPLDNRIVNLVQMFVVAVLVIWMMGALRQRPDTQEAAKRVDQLNLAPIGRRVLGGLIDALPILIALIVAKQFAAPAAGADSGGDPDSSLTYASPQVAWIAAGIAIYLLHTTAFELLFARSPGKFATGTRVAALDGTRPTLLALLTRNLLRIVDLLLLFPPIFVFFSPLRQRVGDMAAGTLVVMTMPMEPGDASGDDTASPSPPPK